MYDPSKIHFIDLPVWLCILIFLWMKVGSVGCCPTGDQEVAGSTPAGLATFFHGD